MILLSMPLPEFAMIYLLPFPYFYLKKTRCSSSSSSSSSGSSGSGSSSSGSSGSSSSSSSSSSDGSSKKTSSKRKAEEISTDTTTTTTTTTTTPDVLPLLLVNDHVCRNLLLQLSEQLEQSLNTAGDRTQVYRTSGSGTGSAPFAPCIYQ